jgi:hypothetical protein
MKVVRDLVWFSMALAAPNYPKNALIKLHATSVGGGFRRTIHVHVVRPRVTLHTLFSHP